MTLEDIKHCTLYAKRWWWSHSMSFSFNLWLLLYAFKFLSAELNRSFLYLQKIYGIIFLRARERNQEFITTAAVFFWQKRNFFHALQWLVVWLSIAYRESCWKRLSFSTHDHYYVTLCPFFDANSLATTNDISSAYSIRHLKKMSSFTSLFYTRSRESFFFKFLIAAAAAEGMRKKAQFNWMLKN